MAQTVRYAAPGRINLIGEHTDYNLGWALPIALPERTVVSFAPDSSEAITVRSNRADGWLQIPLHTGPGDVTGWASYVAGVVWALRAGGHSVPGGTMSITSDVEMGSGLGSSAGGGLVVDVSGGGMYPVLTKRVTLAPGRALPCGTFPVWPTMAVPRKQLP